MLHSEALRPAIFSTAFRGAAYLFLRYVPSKWLLWIIGFTFPAWVLFTTLTPIPSTISVKEEGSSDKAETNPKAYVDGDEPFMNIMFSLPAASKLTRYVSGGINWALLGMVFNLILAPVFFSASDVVFSRVGAVESDRVKIQVRMPPTFFNESAQLVWREYVADVEKAVPWKTGPKLTFAAENDFVDVQTLKGLWPNNRYEYAVADSTGTVLNGTDLETPLQFKFHTFPDPRLQGNNFSFVTSSCQKPNIPYTPTLDKQLYGYDLLSDAIARGEIAPEFMLHLGDFIYADVPISLGTKQEDFRRLYRQNYASPSFRKVYEQLPILHAYDDHEIADDYAGDGDDLRGPFLNATSAFKTYAADLNYDPIHKGTYYYDFRYGDSAFFVMDARRYRTSSTEDMAARVFLGDEQSVAFHEWLHRANNTAVFKFVVTSVPFTTLWHGLNGQTDTWAGFPTERQAILDVLHTIPNVIILSGDRHEFAAVEYNSPTGFTVREFSTSPMSMFDVPLLRTMSKKGEAVVKRVKQVIREEESGEVNVEEVEEEIPAEHALKYIPKGNYKWSTIDVDTTNTSHPTLRVRVSIDDKLAWTYNIDGIAVKISGANAIGTFVASGIRDVFGKLGISPTSWF